MASSKRSQWKAGKRVLRYVLGTIEIMESTIRRTWIMFLLATVIVIGEEILMITKVLLGMYM